MDTQIGASALGGKDTPQAATRKLSVQYRSNRRERQNGPSISTG